MLLLGGLAGLGTLAHGGELLAMRAAGVSVRRIIWSLMKTGLVMTMVMVLTGEFLVPRSEEFAHHMKQAAIADRITLKTKSPTFIEFAPWFNLLVHTMRHQDCP